MANPAVTYTFTNGTSADAGQVNTNFTDLINSLTDGTKSLSIDALTVAGTGTFNGNNTFGNSSSDDVTFTGSLASSIPVKTNATYNFGSSTLGLLSVYLGNNSQTVRITGSSSMSATYTLTLPVSAGLANQQLYNTGSGTLEWRHSPAQTAGADADTTLTTASSRIQKISTLASVVRSYTLPSTGVKAGEEWVFICDAAAVADRYVLIKAADASVVGVVHSGGNTTVVRSLIDDPADSGDWHVVYMVEYSSNSTDGTSTESTAFTYGPLGGPLPNNSLGGNITRRSRFLVAMKQNDRIDFEVDLNDAGQWRKIPGITSANYLIAPYQTYSGLTAAYGAGALKYVSTTDIDAAFGRYAAYENSTNYNWGTNYPGNWRIVKITS